MAAAVLHVGVVDALAADMVSGTLPAEAAVTLEDICQRFGVSRTVAREAMRVLESVRMVAPRRRVGVVVQPSSQWNHLDPRVIQWRLESDQKRTQLRALAELRAAVEPVAAAAAARNATTDEANALVLLAMALADATGDTEAFLAADVAFHTEILQISGNELFAALSDALAVTISGRHKSGMWPERPRQEAIQQHILVANAIRLGDSEAAYAHATAMQEGLREELFSA